LNRKGIFIFLFTAWSWAQTTSGLGSWNILSAQLRWNEHWGNFAEGQLRSLQWYQQFHYYEFKGGLTYYARPDVAVSLGVGTFQTYREGGDFVLPTQQSEMRIWEQASLKNAYGKLNLEHRYRIEQRFTAQQGLLHRFRYRIGFTYPIKGQVGTPNSHYLLAWDELFFTDLSPHYQRNRLCVGWGWEMSAHWTLQSGFIYQHDYKLFDETGRDFWFVSWMYQWDHRKSNKTIPQTVD